MISKALLVSARAGVQGPAVGLSRGKWKVRPPEHVKIGYTPSEALVDVNDGLLFNTPVRLRAEVSEEYEGPDIHLDIVLQNV